MPALIFPAGSSTTIVDDDISWNDWSPHLNWSHEEFYPFIASTKFDPTFPPTASDPYFAAASHNIFQDCSTNTSSTTTRPAEYPTFPTIFPVDPDKPQRILHLLMAAAEALSGDQNSRDLARVILIRLKELVPIDHAVSGIDRLAVYFTDALHAILTGDNDHLSHHHYAIADVLTAFQLLQEMTPFASFGHLTANQAILESVAGERRVHIVDYDIAEGVQWASLIQAMTSSRDSAATLPPHLKITAITSSSRRSGSVAQEAGRRLSNFAASVGQPFSFRLCRLDQRKRFHPAAVKVVKGEPVVVNCVLHLGHGSSSSVGSFLDGATALGAQLVTVVEEEGGGSDGEQKGGFLRRFMNELEKYMAILESLEAGFPKQGRVREMVERVILGPMIARAVRKAYLRIEESEAAVEGCGQWMLAAGFEKVGLSFFNLCQARLLLGLFNDGYRVEEDAPNKIVLSWKSCRLLSASVWAIPTLRSPSPWPAV